MNEMKGGECPNCGGDYGPNDIVCSYCGAPIVREPEGYGGFSQQSYQTSNGGTQVIQNIYVTNGNPNSIPYANVNVNAGASSSYSRSRSRLIAAILAIIFGGIGMQFFYLNKTGLGILCLIFCYTGIPAIFGVFHGVMLLKMSDVEFSEKYHIRAV